MTYLDFVYFAGYLLQISLNSDKLVLTQISKKMLPELSDLFSKIP